MKALSVKNPWAALIGHGRKTVELRTWRARYRGELLVCASARPSRTAPFFDVASDAPCGVAVCAVELVTVREATPYDTEDALCVPEVDDFAWELRLLYRVKPVPILGKLSFFEVDDRLIVRLGSRSPRSR